VESNQLPSSLPLFKRYVSANMASRTHNLEVLAIVLIVKNRFLRPKKSSTTLRFRADICYRVADSETTGSDDGFRELNWNWPIRHQL